MDPKPDSVHVITRTDLDRAIDEQSHLFLSASVRFVREILIAVQRGERVVVEDGDQ